MEQNDQFVVQCNEGIAGLTQVGVDLERIRHSLDVLDQQQQEEEKAARKRFNLRGLFGKRVF